MRTPASPFPMLSPPRRSPHQSRSLQQPFYAAVAPPDLVFFHQLLVKVLHVEPPVALLIQTYHLLYHPHRHPPRARTPTPPIHQPLPPHLVGSLSPPPHRPVTDSDNLRCLNQLIFFAAACNITSCTLIIRSTAAPGYPSMHSCLLHFSFSFAACSSGHFTCYSHRTYHVLLTTSKMSLEFFLLRAIMRQFFREEQANARSLTTQKRLLAFGSSGPLAKRHLLAGWPLG
jgi:hypothetical protein